MERKVSPSSPLSEKGEGVGNPISSSLSLPSPSFLSLLFLLFTKNKFNKFQNKQVKNRKFGLVLWQFSA